MEYLLHTEEDIKECLIDEDLVEEQMKEDYLLSTSTPPTEPTTSTSSNSPEFAPLFPDFKSEDDIRNKIKQQLELLRTNRKPTNKDDPLLPTTSKKTDKRKIQQANLNDVLISNDQNNLVIVSVVGGYVSDEEDENPAKHCELHTEKTDTTQTFTSTGDSPKKIIEFSNKEEIDKLRKSNAIKDVSMTDVLLKRDYSNLDQNLDADNSKTHLIKPTKTTDITKIKGWKSKHFTISESKDLEIDQKDPPTIDSEDNEIPSCTDLSMPSTSKALFDQPKTTKKSPESMSILKQGEYKSNDTKAAFVSDVLDTFLNNHAELKISYEVPKLSAEEAISKPKGEIPIVTSIPEEQTSIPYIKPNRTNKNESNVKAKTLAEKRRLLEMERQSKLVMTMETNESTFIKQLEKENKRHSVVKSIRNELLNQTTPFTKQCWQLATKDDVDCIQYAVLNGQRIRIVGSSGGNDIILNHISKDIKEKCNIKETITQPKEISNKKIIVPKVEYKPGPLSKKHKLIKTKNDNCEYEVLKLPKIKLILYPKLGKPLPRIAEQYLHLCKDEKGIISDELAKFAVSAVRCKGKSIKKVEFDIPYENHQNKILLRKIVKKVPVLKQPIIIDKYKNSNVDMEIKNIMSDMLDSIENQMLDDVIIKEDPDLVELHKSNESVKCRPLSPVNPMVQAIIKRPNNRKSRTTLELRRLNVQVIEVDVEEDLTKHDHKINCTKEYCKMGCVCKSLSGVGGPLQEHCGREQCMFQCNCTASILHQAKHHSVTLPAGTDILSASTMVRLQDEAVRHLAKEEKKFTQTVIKANNQTIVVGGGARDRQRRVPKLPKKYTDYVNTSEELVNIQQAAATEEPPPPPIEDIKFTRKIVPIWKNNNKKKELKANKKCYINLEKLKMNNVLPWCMVHNLYKCYCGGIPEEKEEPPNRSPKTSESEDSEYITYAPRYGGRQSTVRNEPKTEVTSTPTVEKLCARTRTLQTNYQARNKTPAFKARYAQLKQEDEANCVDFDSYLNNPQKSKRKYNRKDKRKVDGDSDNELLVVRKRKKKINIENGEHIFNASEKSPAKIENYSEIGNEKPVTKFTPPEDIKERVKVASLVDYERSYNGLLLPTPEWSNKFQEMLNLSNIVHHIRLLRWTYLVSRYKNTRLQLWLNTKRNFNNITLTENKAKPSRYHINVKSFEKTITHDAENFKVPDIISSLLTNKLPGNAKNPEETYVIIVNYGMDWEARGTIVLNNTTEQCRAMLGNKPLPPLLLANDLKFAESPFKGILQRIENSDGSDAGFRIFKPDTGEITILPKSSRDKDLNASHSVDITKMSKSPNSNSPEFKQVLSRPYKTPDDKSRVQESLLSPEVIKKINTEIETKNTETKKNILASLPTTKDMHRWFVLKLENDFSALRISSVNMTVKYAHLTVAVQMAKKKNQTVKIRTHDKTKPGSVDSSFGIYAVPDFSDKICFGPYNEGEDHGLETYRYINGKLYDTKTYFLMRGFKAEELNGEWIAKANLNINPLPVKSPSVEVKKSINPDAITRPEIEFVDLTGNDSEDENNSPKKQVMDPLYNVLATDFSKNVKDDITIERISEDGKKTTVENKSEVIFKQKLPIPYTKKVDVNEILHKESKRKSHKHKLLSEMEEIEIIHIDDDSPTSPKKIKTVDKVTISPNKEKKKRLPSLYPINAFKDQKRNSNSLLKPLFTVVHCVGSPIPGLGYIEVVQVEDQYHVPALGMSTIDGSQVPKFKTMDLTLDYIRKFLKEIIYHLPSDLDLQLTVLRSKDLNNKMKFDTTLLNGFYMVCEKGVFDIFTLTTNQIDNFGFTDDETTEILSHKCKVLIKKNIQILGFTLLGPNADNMEDSTILGIAPEKIKVIEQEETSLGETKKKLLKTQKEYLATINSLLQVVSPSLAEQVKKNIRCILCKNYKYVVNLDTEKSVLKSNVNNIPNQPNSSPDNIIQLKSGQTSHSPINISSLVTLPSGKLVTIVDRNIILVDKTIPKKTVSPPKTNTPVSTKPSTLPKMLTAEQIQNMKIKKANGSYVIYRPVDINIKTSNKAKTNPMITDLTDS